MNNPSNFPPKGFHIERGIDTPYGPMDMLVENEGIRLDIDWAIKAAEQPVDLLSNTVQLDSGSKERTAPDQEL